MIFFVLVGFWISSVLFTTSILIYCVYKRVEKRNAEVQTEHSNIQKIVIHPNDDIQITSFDSS